MAWVQISTILEEALAEPCSDTLMELGAVSVTFSETGEQEIFEPEIGTTPIWQKTRVTGLFDAQVDGRAIVEQLIQRFTQTQAQNYKVDQVEDKDWVREWMDQFKPMPFGERLWIVPSWHTPPEPNAVNLMLDPGMAFGTGTHPTTAMCLKWLDQHPPKGLEVIDYGCGSGILAVAAAKLGSASVKATDIDPQAILACQDNASRNQVDIDARLVDDFPQLQPVDVLIANILAGPLQELATTFDQLLKPNAQLVLSGLLLSQAEGLIQHYQTLNIQLKLINHQEDWALLAGYKHQPK